MPKNSGYERGIGGHDLSVGGPTGKGGNQGVKQDGTQCGASGLNELSPGSQPGSSGLNYGAGSLTKGTISGGEVPAKDPGTGGGGVGPLSILQGPGHDTEKTYSE
jgi:hypothetical protein